MVNYFDKYKADLNRSSSLKAFDLDLDNYSDFANNKDYISINNIVMKHIVNIIDVVNLNGFMSMNRYISLNRSIKQSVQTYELNKTIIERLKNELKSDFHVNEGEIKNLEKLNVLVREEIEDSIGSFKDRLVEDTRKCMNEILTETTRISEEAMGDLNRVKNALLENDLEIELNEDECDNECSKEDNNIDDSNKCDEEELDECEDIKDDCSEAKCDDNYDVEDTDDNKE